VKWNGPIKLPIVLCGQDASVEEHQNNDEPVECLGFDSLAAGSASKYHNKEEEQ